MNTKKNQVEFTKLKRKQVESIDTQVEPVEPRGYVFPEGGQDDNLVKVHGWISKNNKRFKIGYDQFKTDMADENNLVNTFLWLQNANPDFKVDYDTFAQDMGYQLKKKDSPQFGEDGSPENTAPLPPISGDSQPNELEQLLQEKQDQLPESSQQFAQDANAGLDAMQQEGISAPGNTQLGEDPEGLMDQSSELIQQDKAQRILLQQAEEELKKAITDSGKSRPTDKEDATKVKDFNKQTDSQLSVNEHKSELDAAKKVYVDQALDESIQNMDNGLNRFVSGLGEASRVVVGALAAKPLKAAAILSDKYFPDWFNGYAEGTKAQEYVSYRWGEALEKWAKEVFPTNPKFQGEFWASSFAQGFGSLMGMALGGIGRGGAGSITSPLLQEVEKSVLKKATGDFIKNISSGSMLVGGTMMGVHGYEEAIAAGASEDDAFEVFIFDGVAGTTDAIPIMIWAKRLNSLTGGGMAKLFPKRIDRFKNITGALLQQGITEMSQEVVQNFLTNLVAKDYYDEFRKLYEGMATDGAVGFALGALLGAGSSMAVHITDAKERGKFEAYIETEKEKLKRDFGIEIPFSKEFTDRQGGGVKAPSGNLGKKPTAGPVAAVEVPKVEAKESVSVQGDQEKSTEKGVKPKQQTDADKIQKSIDVFEKATPEERKNLVAKIKNRIRVAEFENNISSVADELEFLNYVDESYEIKGDYGRVYKTHKKLNEDLAKTTGETPVTKPESKSPEGHVQEGEVVGQGTEAGDSQKVELKTDKIDEANETAKSKGFDSASHALNSIKKRTGKEYKTVQEVPDKVWGEVSNQRGYDKLEAKAKELTESIDQLKAENPNEFKKDGGLRSKSKITGTYKALVDMRQGVYAQMQSSFEEEFKKRAKEESEKSRIETDKINKDFEERTNKDIDEEEKTFDEINRIFAKVTNEEEITQEEVDYVNEKAFLPKGFVFSEAGLVKEKGQKVSKKESTDEAELNEAVEESDKIINDDYKMQHRITRDEESTTTLDDMTKGGDLVPDDFYSKPHFYADVKDKAVKESLKQINSANGKPKKKVTIYRAVPKGVTKINEGDWISLSPTYAKQHGLHETDESQDMPVISMEVNAEDVVWDGNDVNEFAYFPKQTNEQQTEEPITPTEQETVEEGSEKTGEEGVVGEEKPKLEKGQKVDFVGHDGGDKKGTIESYDSKTGKYKIRQDSGTVWNVKEENIKAENEGVEAVSKRLDDIISKTKETKPKDPRIITINLNPFVVVRAAFGALNKAQNITFGKVIKRLEDWTSKKIKKGITARNYAIRNAANASQNLIGGLAYEQGDLKNKLNYMGNKNYAHVKAKLLAIEMYKVIDSDQASLARIHSVLDPEIADDINKGLTYNDLNDSEKSLHDIIRATNEFIHEWHYKERLIGKKTYKKFKGKYIARLYEKFELIDPEVDKAFKSSRADFNMFKERKNYEDVEANILRDPVFTTAKRMAQMLQNQAIFDYAKAIENSNIQVRDSEFPGSKQLGQKGKPYYGVLTGKYVPAYIAQDFTGFAFGNQFLNSVYSVFRGYDKLMLRQFLKRSHTVYNPLVQLGNLMSNYSFAFWTGIDPLTFTINKVEAKREIKNKGEKYLELVKAGLIGADIFTSDVTPLKIIPQPKNVYEKIRNKINQAGEWASEHYGKTDDIAKLSAYISLKQDGYSKEDALELVYEGFQNYATVGKLYDFAAKTPIIGNPYIKFKADLMRILKNGVAKRPFTMALYLGMLVLVKDLLSDASGEDDDIQKVRERRNFIPKIYTPFGDIPLVFQTPFGEINFARYISPYYIYDKGEKDDMINDITEWLPYQFEKVDKYPLPQPEFSDVFLGVYAQLLFDRDFRGMSILDPDATKYTGEISTTHEKRLNALFYIARSQVPMFKSAQDMISAYNGNADYYGRERTLTQAILNNVIKIQEFGSEQAKESLEKEIRYLNGKFESLSRDIAQLKSVSEKKIDKIYERDISQETKDRLVMEEYEKMDKRILEKELEQVEIVKKLEEPEKLIGEIP